MNSHTAHTLIRTGNSIPRPRQQSAIGTTASRCRSWLAFVAGLLCTAAVSLPVAAESSQSMGDIAKGDALWSTRAFTLSDELAAPAAIESAIEHYERATRAGPNDLEPRWKLLRALHYSVDFTDRDEDAKQASVDQAVALAQSSIPLLESGDGTTEDRARLYFWSGIAWGTKAGRVGLLTIVREGLATRMHDFAQQSLELDPTVDQGGALRLLSRLHATLPRVPFVSGWVDRKKALDFAERALALDPKHPGNQLIMALTLLERAPDRESEARAFLASVIKTEPRDEYRAEDLAIQTQAFERLEELNRESK